jgi:hypothetical protein
MFGFQFAKVPTTSRNAAISLKNYGLMAGWSMNITNDFVRSTYLKTAEGRALYEEQKKHFAAHPAPKPTSKKRKAPRIQNLRISPLKLFSCRYL